MSYKASTTQLTTLFSFLYSLLLPLPFMKWSDSGEPFWHPKTLRTRVRRLLAASRSPSPTRPLAIASIPAQAHIEQIVQTLSLPVQDVSQLSVSYSISVEEPNPISLTPDHRRSTSNLATAADLPPELLIIIAEYIGANANGSRKEFPFGESHRSELMNGSLVCLDWAKRCRERLFGRGWITLKSYNDLTTVESFLKHTSRRFKPSSAFIRTILVEQNWDSSAWCYRLYNSPIRQPRQRRRSRHRGPLNRREQELLLCGPVPANLPHAAYRSPHWSLPRTLPQCFLPFHTIKLHKIHFPRLSDLHKLLGHVSPGRDVSLNGATWDKTDIPDSRRLYGTYVTRMNTSVRAQDCTDNVLPCVFVFRRQGRSKTPAFSRLSDRELEMYLALFRLAANVGNVDSKSPFKLPAAFEIEQFYDIEEGNAEVYNVTAEALAKDASSRTRTIRFWLTCKSRANNAGPESMSSLRCVKLNMRIEYDHPTALRSDRRFLASLVRAFHATVDASPDLLVAEFEASLDIFRLVVKHSPDLCQLPTRDGQLFHRWICSKRDFPKLATPFEYDYVALNPTTLEPCAYYYNSGSKF